MWNDTGTETLIEPWSSWLLIGLSSRGERESSRLWKNYWDTIEIQMSVRLEQWENYPAGCSKSPSSKAAASEGPRRTLWGTLRV